MIAYMVKELAEEEGWEQADLFRVLICAGACLSFSTLEKPERLDVIKANDILARIPSLLSPDFGRGRPYAIRVGSGTRVLVVHVPVELAHVIQDYAKILRTSRNETCGLLLAHGLFMYLNGKRKLLKTQVELARQSREIDELVANRNRRQMENAKD